MERAMHNDLAWAVLGVEPGIQKIVEGSAAEQGLSLGQWLELMIAGSRAVAANASRASEQRVQMCQVVVDMAESLVSAARLLGIETTMGDDKAQVAKTPAAADPAPSEALKPADRDVPNVEELQVWMRALDEKKAGQARSESKLSEFRRGLLRVSA
jgi:hypothetical protein